MKYSYDIDVKPSEKSMRLLGENTSVKYAVGDWGVDIPVLKISKISKVDSGKYRVVAKAILLNDFTGKTTTYGTVTLDVKKKSGSYYGYIAKKLTIKKI